MGDDPDSRSGATPGYRELLAPLAKPFMQNRGLLMATIGAGWAKFLIPLAIPLIVARVLDEVLTTAAITGGDTSQVMPGLIWYGSISLAVIAAASVGSYYRSTLAQQVAARVQHSLRRKLFTHLQRLSMAFFQRHHAGALGARVSADINHAGTLIDKGLVQYAMDGVQFLVVVILMLTSHVWLSIGTLVVLSLNAVVLYHYTPRIRSGRKLIQEGQSGITGQAAEIFAGISLVKAYTGERETRQLFHDRSERVMDLQWENSRVQGSFQALSNGCVQLAVWTVVFIGGWLAVAEPGLLTKGELVKFIMLVGVLNGSVQRMIDAMVQVQDGFAALERINDLLRVAPTPADQPEAATPVITGELRFTDVHFAYGVQPVLNGFSFTFAAGRTYALVGPSGSGKSSLCQLMLRFWDPQQGSVRVDGHELRSIQQQHYRQHVAVVLQDPIIFSTTARDNIDFGVEDATQEQVEAAARKAQAHDFIMELPKGYDTRLGERGVSLSGGQRQRIAIARALMREPKLLILDEATSALDTVTERAIQGVVDHLRGHCTIVVIAHRLSTIRNVDEIVVLDRGRIAEHGSYDDLLARDGLFARLVAEQQDESITPPGQPQSAPAAG